MRHPVQERAQKTRESLLKAAAAVFGEVGFEGATTHAIAERAGVSVGSLYAYFADKRALLHELFDRHAEEVIAIVRAPFEDLDAEDFNPRQGIRTAVEAAVRSHDHDPALHRVFAGMQSHPALRERWKGWEETGLTALRGVLVMAGDALRIRDPELAAFIIYHAVMGSSRPSVLFGEGPDLDTLTDGLTDLLARYLIEEGPVSNPDS